MAKRKKDYIKIGGSPVPGIVLRRILKGQTEFLRQIAWSPDGQRLAATTYSYIIVWDTLSGEILQTFRDKGFYGRGLSWSPDGRVLCVACSDNFIRIWDVDSGKLHHQLRGHSRSAECVVWSPSGRFLSSTGEDGKLIIWLADDWTIHQSIQVHNASTHSLALSPNEQLLATGSFDNTISLVDVTTGKQLRIIKGHSGSIYGLAWSLNGQTLFSGSMDKTIGVWEIDTGQQSGLLEGHTNGIVGISISADGDLLASKALDDTVRLWRCDTWETLAVLREKSVGRNPIGINFHPKLQTLATIVDAAESVNIWDFELVLLKGMKVDTAHKYTSAKLVLVGDSGVGKTGLGWRLAHGEFKEHASTHGQQFWSIPQLNLKRKDGTDCEAVLWDLAGQHVYRQVHSIFLENVAAALVLFDPTNRQEPLKGAQFWLEQLKGKGQLPPTVLVGARVDRGAPALSQDELNQFCQRYGIKGGYISTSALKGDGLNELLEIVKAQIPWDNMTATVTTVTFKRIKDYVLSLKEKTDRKGVLISPAELRKQLEKKKKPSKQKRKTAEVWEFTDAEMMTAVGHLETNGIITILKSSSGESHFLLAPDLLVNMAASIMILADKNPRELGAVSETELLQGKYQFEELKGLEKTEQQILIDAAILRFLEHSICFRETLGNDTLLIFPSLIKQKRPLQDDLPATDDISYIVRGRVENLYASLVVLLGYTPTFTRINQWQNQAQYEMREGEICGFRMIEEREGEIELVLYYGDKLPQSGRDKFQELFEQFLYQRDVEVTRFPPVTCKNHHRIERATVVKRVREGKDFVFCDECGDKTFLPDFAQPQTIGIGASPWLQREEAIARLRSSYEKHLTNIKSYRRGWATPRAYLSHLPEQKDWAKKLIHDLQDAGVYIIAEAAQVKPDDFLILLDTSDYRKSYQSSSPALAQDSKLIQSRLKGGNKKVIALACEGKSYAHTFIECRAGDFCDETHYPVSLYDLVLDLYAISLNHKGFAPLRQALHVQWEQTLAGKEIIEMKSALKIFISYSHKDEVFKDDLLTFLKPLENRRILEIWHDRKIEAGDEWRREIEKAMKECDMALLFISKQFLASPFIQDKEVPQLLQRRKEKGLRIMPIIIGPCMWQGEPVLSDLQALPKDAQPISSFAEGYERDQVWTTIAQEIEKRAKAKAAV